MMCAYFWEKFARFATLLLSVSNMRVFCFAILCLYGHKIPTKSSKPNFYSVLLFSKKPFLFFFSKSIFLKNPLLFTPLLKEGHF